MTDKPATTSSDELDRIAQIWAGGEHLRAAALAAEAKLSKEKLDELSILCPGIIDHMPGEPGTVREMGTVAGDPVKDTMDRLRVDENQIGEINRRRREEGVSPKEALAEADLKPSGTPDNTGKDGPTLHAGHSNAKTQPRVAKK